MKKVPILRDLRPLALKGVTHEEFLQANQASALVPGTATRSTSAEASIARVTPYLKDFGITRVANVTHLDRVGVPVHTALKPMGTTLSNGSGKGLNHAASKIGAIMEAIEQSYWETVELDLTTASQKNLEKQGQRVACGNNLPTVKNSLWHEGLSVDWACGQDLVTGEEVFIPAELIRAGTSASQSFSTFVTSSNGLASGNNVFEAILSGLTELIERDAVTMNKVEGRGQTFDSAIDLDQISALYGEPFVSLREQIERADLRLHVVDTTHELAIPTYKAYVHDLAITTVGSFAGYGTSLNPSVALCRAVTEAMQSRGLVIAGSRDDQFISGRDASMMYTSHHEAPAIGTMALINRPNLGKATIMAEILEIVDRLYSAGMKEILVFRYTNPGDPAQVVRVVVPGLEGYFFDLYSAGPRARAAMKRGSSTNSGVLKAYA
jgi:ribosomal protein S12 methylthiotransferase accessory factor